MIRKVFLSSTWRDLHDYREAVFLALQACDDIRVVRMEDFGARDEMTDEFCRRKVAECDLFVGIVGHCFGSCPKGSDKSYTQQEYDAAVVLSELGHTDDAVRILLALAQDEKLDELVRRDAAFALGKLEKKSPRVAEALLKLSGDANANVRDAAYCALKEVLGVG
jgi:hypothetical protein